MTKVIIVGGGIAGLAAGVYARQSGFDVEIYEMHTIPGGNSTSWMREGYLFEGGMHWLVGSNPKLPLHQVWREVGALQDNNPIYNRDPFMTYMDGSEQIHLFRDVKRLRQHLLTISPQDKEAINQLIKDIKRLGKIVMPIMDIEGLRAKYKSKLPVSLALQMLPALRRMHKLGGISVSEYIERFQHPGIRALLGNVVGDGEFAASSLAFTMGGFITGDGGYPEGGSLQMARNMANTFTGLGGGIHYGTRVERIHVKDGFAEGVWVNGELHESDAVIVAADTRAAIDQLFDEPLCDPWMEDLRRELAPLNNTFIGIGVKADLKHLPETMIFPLERPFSHEGTEYHTIAFNNYANYEGYAPEGCTALTCAIMQDTYDEWKAAKEDGSYKQKKEALAQAIIDCLASCIPETAGNVETWTVATPLTYERFCGTYRGSWMSILQADYRQRQQYPCKSETIQGLFFAGQRLTLPGDLPVAVSTGRQSVQQLCVDLNDVFQVDYSRE